MATSLFESPQGEVKGLPSTAGTGSRAQQIDTALEQGMAAARRRAQEAGAVPAAVEEANREAITSAREERARQFAANRRLGAPLAQSLGASGTGSMVAASDEARARSQAAMGVAQARLDAAQAQQDASMAEAGFLAEQEALAAAPQAKLQSFLFEMRNEIAAAEGMENKAATAMGFLTTLAPNSPEYETLASNILNTVAAANGFALPPKAVAALRAELFSYEDMINIMADYPYKKDKSLNRYIRALLGARLGRGADEAIPATEAGNIINKYGLQSTGK